MSSKEIPFLTMTTQLQFTDSGSTLLTSKGPRRVDVRHDDAKYEMKIVNQLTAHKDLFVLPWARQVVLKPDGTKTETIVEPRFDKTLMHYLAKYQQSYMPMSVARLVLAYAVHRDIGKALNVLKSKKMEHHGLAPCAIFMFKENLRLGLLQYVCLEGDTVDLSPIHQKTIPQYENSLDKITEDLRGPVPSKELASFLEANGINCSSWLCEDTRVLRYKKGSEPEDDAESEPEDDAESEYEEEGDPEEDEEEEED